MREGFRLYWRLSHSTRTRRRLQEFVTGLASRALSILELPERKAFLEKEIERSFGFRRVEILIRPEGHERFSSESTRVRSLLARVLGILDGLGLPFLNRAVGKERGVAAILGQIDGTYCFAVKQSQKSLGLLVIDTSPMTQLDADLEKVLLSLCDQLAVVLENSNLLRGKLELERTVSQQAQMVQLGEMTARIAREIRNPASLGRGSGRRRRTICSAGSGRQWAGNSPNPPIENLHAVLYYEATRNRTGTDHRPPRYRAPGRADHSGKPCAPGTRNAVSDAPSSV